MPYLRIQKGFKRHALNVCGEFKITLKSVLKKFTDFFITLIATELDAGGGVQDPNAVPARAAVRQALLFSVQNGMLYLVRPVDSPRVLYI